jgi:hypothetical protein
MGFLPYISLSLYLAQYGNFHKFWLLERREEGHGLDEGQMRAGQGL